MFNILEPPRQRAGTDTQSPLKIRLLTSAAAVLLSFFNMLPTYTRYF